MLTYRAKTIALLATLVLSSYAGIASADTWQLEQGQNWKPIEAKDEDKYLLLVARTEKLISTGQRQALSEEWNKLKELFSHIEKKDLNNFIKAELFFCEGKFSKAANTYNKFLDKNYYQSRLYDAALERQFHIAEAYLAGREKRVLGIFKIKGYAEGLRIMESIADRAGDRDIGLRAGIIVAENYEKRKMFNEAYLKWSEISWQSKTSQEIKQTLLSMARCKYALYRGPKYDASCLKTAKSHYEDFKLRFPQDAKEFDIDNILKQINEQMAYKQLCIGQYYEKVGNKLSANLYYDMVIQNWPNSNSAESARQIRLQQTGDSY